MTPFDNYPKRVARNTARVRRDNALAGAYGDRNKEAALCVHRD